MNTKCTKLSAILLFAAGGLSTVSAQTAPVVYQKLGENPFELNGSAALQIDSKDRGFLLPRVDPASITGAVHGLIILNDAPADPKKPDGARKFQGADQLQINIGGSGLPTATDASKWVGFTSSSPTISTQTGNYTLVGGDSTVLFDLSAKTTPPTDVSVTLPAVTADNAGKIYVINRIDNNGDRKLIFKIDKSADADSGLVLSAGANKLKELNYAKKITVQANYQAANSSVTPATSEVATWNIINMN